VWGEAGSIDGYVGFAEEADVVVPITEDAPICRDHVRKGFKSGRPRADTTANDLDRGVSRSASTATSWPPRDAGGSPTEQVSTTINVRENSVIELPSVSD
jgi:hypothetical protein